MKNVYSSTTAPPLPTSKTQQYTVGWIVNKQFKILNHLQYKEWIFIEESDFAVNLERLMNVNVKEEVDHCVYNKGCLIWLYVCLIHTQI